jgi:hypothetical protein
MSLIFLRQAVFAVVEVGSTLLQYMLLLANTGNIFTFHKKPTRVKGGKVERVSTKAKKWVVLLRIWLSNMK